MHGERRTPVFGLIVSSVLVSGLVLYNWNASFADRFTDVVLLATLMTLIAYAYAAAASSSCSSASGSSSPGRSWHATR